MTDTHDSYLQSDARQEAISAQKELFLRGLPVDTTVVSDFVLRSWQLSRLAGVDPETTVRKKVDETIFRHILAANAADMAAGLPSLGDQDVGAGVLGGASFGQAADLTSDQDPCVAKPGDGVSRQVPE